MKIRSVVEIKTLGEYLQYKMKEKKVSTRELAKELGIPSTTVWRISTGHSFRMENLIPVAKWCGLTAQELFDLLDRKGK